MVVTPSKPNYFVGTRVPDDAKFTDEQIRKAHAMRQGIERNLALYDLPSEYTIARWRDPRAGEPLPVEIRVTCPVIGCRKDRTKLRVIAPNGLDLWTDWRR